MRGLFEGWHLVVVLLIVLVVFGARRLPEVAKSVGQSMKIFKAEMKDLQDDRPSGSRGTGTGSTGTGSTGTDSSGPADQPPTS